MADNAYEQIDPTIDQWVTRHKLTLFIRTEGFDGQPRSVYLSSDSECFQIWIDPPTQDGIGVHAADVETRDDEAMRQDWSPGLPQLASVLDEAVLHVRRWLERPTASGR